MNKSTALKIIYSCVKEYEKNLRDKTFLFVWEGHGKRGYQEVAFYDSNFMHLTGVKLQGKNIDGPKHFYENCLKNEVSLNDFTLCPRGTSELKLRVLPTLINIQHNAKMFCTYTGSRFNLQTDKLIGGTRGFLGFVKDAYHKEGFYVPNTAMNADIRSEGDPIYKIVSIFSKHLMEDKYSVNRYTSKDYTIEKVLLSNVEVAKLCIHHNDIKFEI